MAESTKGLRSLLHSYVGDYFSNPVGDLIGGVTAAVIALPLALAFGVASGLGPAAGLYGAIACGLFAAFFGGTKGQVSGPTGPMTVVTTGLFLAAGGVNNPGAATLVFAAVIVAGFLQIALGIFRLGTLIHYIPYPVISGFMTGIGVIIIILQIPVLFGLQKTGGVIDILGIYGDIPKEMNSSAAVLGIGTLLAIILLKRFVPKLPGALVALLLATLISYVLKLNIPTIGPIPAGAPVPHIPMIEASQLRALAQAALALALLGSIDSLLTSVVVDRLTGTRHNSNRELVGQGIGNAVSGLIGGIPGAGATMRSVVNINSGGRTNLSGVIHGLVLFAVLLGLGSLTSHIPLACLAGILIHVGITIVDYRGLRTIRKAPRADTAVMLIVLGLTVFVDLIVAVIVGIAIASILFAKKLSDARTSAHGPLRDEDVSSDYPEDLKRCVYLYTFKGPLYFGEAKNFGEVMSRVIHDAWQSRLSQTQEEKAFDEQSARQPPGIRYVVLVFDNVPLIDQTGAIAIEDTIEQLQRKGLKVYLVHPLPELREMLERIATRPTLLRHGYVETVDAAVQAIAAEQSNSA